MVKLIGWRDESETLSELTPTKNNTESGIQSVTLFEQMIRRETILDNWSNKGHS